VLTDAVAVEPVSTNTDINREFFNFGPTRGSEVAIHPRIKWAESNIPYSTEHGIFVQ
jgi:hypothetical protein